MKRRINAKSVFAMLGGIFFLIGLVFAATGLVFLAGDISFMKDAEITEAKITSIEEEYRHSKGVGRTDRRVWGEYTVDGKTYNEQLDSYSTDMYEGMITEVYFDPEDPSDVRTGSYAFEIIFIGIGGLFLIIGGVFLAVYFVLSGKKKRLMQRGEALTGKITDVRINNFVRINNMHPYKADCEVINPFDGERYLYSSGNITENITEYIGADVTVYVDRNNPKKYYVDIEELIGRKSASENGVHDYRN
ncbi:MAG: DUF3592 domain-containing protein [Porcipelethomonas sp.]